jgi:hypothetical protein
MMENRVNKALDLMGFYSSFDEVKENLGLSEQEMNELKQRAQERYGKEVFCVKA